MPLKYKEVTNILTDNGFVFEHQTGSHHRELKPKTAKSILQDIAKAQHITTKDLMLLYQIKL